MSEREARLAALCSAAGYPDAVRERIAHATFPRYEAGQALSDRQLGELAEAVKLPVQAGRTAEQIPMLIAEDQARHGQRWRHAFWRQTLRTAARRLREQSRPLTTPASLSAPPTPGKKHDQTRPRTSPRSRHRE